VPGAAANISNALAEVGINIRLIIQGIRHEDTTNDVSLIVGEEDAERAAGVLRKVSERVGSPEVSVDTNVAKVSVIGSGIASSPGVAGRMFQALAREGINIELISSSEVRIVCVIARDRLPDAVRAIHREFDLANLERKHVADPA